MSNARGGLVLIVVLIVVAVRSSIYDGDEGIHSYILIHNILSYIIISYQSYHNHIKIISYHIIS
jgi:hypothetical protein